MCNMSWIPHDSLEKDNYLDHFCVCHRMGCLEYRELITKNITSFVYSVSDDNTAYNVLAGE